MVLGDRRAYFGSISKFLNTTPKSKRLEAHSWKRNLAPPLAKRDVANCPSFCSKASGSGLLRFWALMLEIPDPLWGFWILPW